MECATSDSRHRQLHPGESQHDAARNGRPVKEKALASRGMSVLGPSGWFAAYGEYLHNFAKSRLRDYHAADEVVQDTLLGGLQSFDQFRRQATELDWLMGILRHKIADYGRRKIRSRRDQLDDLPQSYRQSLTDKDQYTTGSAWSAKPADEAERQEFWELVEESLKGMPDGPATAFRLSVIECCDTPSICEALNITSTNLWVRLHRARAYLATSLDDRWNQPSL